MREITDIRELQLIELDILKYFDCFCRKNNLTYFISGGTLLGAIRHKGFIPWDDDVDVMMPRQDFNRLIELFKNNKSNYMLFYPGCSSDYYYTFGKLVDNRTELNEYIYSGIEGMGIYVDIFILDGLPSDEELRARHFRKLMKMRKRINNFSIRKPDRTKGFLRFIWGYYHYIFFNIGNIKALQGKLIKMSSKYDYNKSEYVCASGGSHGVKDILKREILDEGIDIFFESVPVRMPVDYKEYLEQLYGNYMKLPPEEMQITHHSFVAHYKE